MKIQTNIPNCIDCDVKHKVTQCASYATKSRINLEKGFKSFEKGEYIFKAGESAPGFYFIKTGTVRTFVRVASGLEQTFTIRSVGDWLGFRDCMAHGEYNYDAVALDKTNLCFVATELIENLVQNDLNFQREVFHQLAEDWKNTEKQIVLLGTMQVHGRLAEILIALDKAQGARNRVELSINRGELASFIGMKAETLVRALTDFKSRNFIAVDKNRIDILDREALLSLARM